MSAYGDLTLAVVVGGDVVDTSEAGPWTITYTVTDSFGNTVEETRNVELAISGQATFTGAGDAIKFPEGFSCRTKLYA